MIKKIITVILSLLISISCFTLIFNKSNKKENSNNLKNEVKEYNSKSCLNEFLKNYENKNISLDSVTEISHEYNIKLNINCNRKEFNSVIESIRQYIIDDFDFVINNDIISGTVSITYKNSQLQYMTSSDKI